MPKVLDNTAVRPREPRLSGEEARRQLSAIAYDLCNLGRLLGWHLEIKKWSLANFKERLVRIGRTLVRQESINGYCCRRGT